jgi:hypothetical protein
MLSNNDENRHHRLTDGMMDIDDEECRDPWQFRPKTGCRYLRVMTYLAIDHKVKCKRMSLMMTLKFTKQYNMNIFTNQ